MFTRQGRPDAKKVLIVIADKKSDSSESEIKEAVKPLEENDVIVIPVALGAEADQTELKKLTEVESTLVTADTSNDTADIKDKIMSQVFKGLLWIHLRYFDISQFPFGNLRGEGSGLRNRASHLAEVMDSVLRF